MSKELILAQAGGLLETLAEMTHYLAGLIYSGKSNQVTEEIPGYLEGLDALFKALRASGEELGWLEAETAALAGPLERLSRAINDRDWVSVSDTLLYELLPRLTGWRERISEVSAGAGTRIRNN